MEAAALIDSLLTQANILIIVAVYSVTQVLTKAFPGVFTSKLAKRLKPGASIVMCIAALYIQNDGSSHGDKILLGVVLGNAASHAHSILKHTIFGGSGNGELESHAQAMVGERTASRMTDRQKMLIHAVKKTLT